MSASRVWFAGTLALSLTAAIPAQPVVFGRATFSYQSFGDEELSSRGFQQIYDLDYQRNVTDPLRLRLSFRGEGNDGSQETSDLQTKNSIWMLRPLGEVTYLLPRLNLRGRYELLDTRASSDDQSSRKRTERVTEALLWTPDDLPSLSLSAEQRQDVDARAGLNQKESSVFQSSRYAWKGLTVGESAHYSDFRLGGADFGRKTMDLQAQLRYENSLHDGRYSFSGGGVGGVSRIDETGGGRTSVSVPTQVPITAALYARDETPHDSRDNPLVPAPRLIDGDFSRGAGIVIGGRDALAYQNIAVDLGRVATLDTLRLSVRDPNGNAIPLGGLVRWDVFESGDALDWALVPGGRVEFIGSLSAYEVTFQKSSFRFFKVVSFGVISVDAVVTEIQAFFHTEFSGIRARRTDLRFLTADLNISARPVNWLTLRYAGLFNDFQTAQPDRPDFTGRDMDHVASVEIAPSRPLAATARYERRTSTAEGSATQTLDGFWGVLRFTPARNLNTAVEVSRISQQGAEELTADTVRLSQYLRLFRALELTVDGGVGRQNLPLQSLEDRRIFANAVSYIQLTRALRLTLAANYQRTEFSGEGSASLPALESKDSRYYGEIFFRPSGQLLLSGRLGYVSGAFVSATTKAYRVEWYPFARGTVGLGTVYDEDIETNGTYRRFRRVQILPRWLINPKLTLNVNYNYLMLLDQGAGNRPAVESKSKQLYVTLIWTL